MQCRNFAVGNEQLSRQFATSFRRVMDEDIVIMEAQQRMNDLLPNAPTVDIRVDEPVIAMRRLVRSYVAAHA